MSRSLVERYGRWAIVTGASSGIGAAFAASLAARGLGIVLVARREERMREVADRVRAHGVDALVVRLDLTRPDAADHLHAAVGEREIGVLVNNAGFGFNGNFLATNVAKYDAMIQLNCAAPVRLTHRFLPAMLRRKRGAILFVGSTASFQPVPYLSVYASTKAFDLLFGEGLAAELRGTGVNVLTLCPGLTKTEFARTARMGYGPPSGADPHDVAEHAVRQLGRRTTLVHGWKNKLGTVAVRMVPRSLVARIVGAAMPAILFKKRRSDFRRDLDRLVERDKPEKP